MLGAAHGGWVVNRYDQSRDAGSGSEKEALFLRVTQEWRQTIDALRDVVCLVDTRGSVLRCNRALQQILNQPFEQITGQSVWSLIFGQDVPPAHCDLAAIADREGAAREISFSQSFFDTWYDVRLRPVLGDGGEVLGAVLVMADISEIRNAEQALAQYAARLRRLGSRMTSAEEEQRRRLARELHDRVGQILTAIGINLNYVRSMIGEQPPMLLERLDEALNQVEQVSDRIRDVMSELRPMVLDDYGLPGALQWYAEQFSRRTGIKVTIHDEAAMPRLSHEVETVLFRIAEEAFTNISKHAEATLVTVTLGSTDATFTMKIADDGLGFDVASKTDRPGQTGWGLMTMQERAASVGARLRVVSLPGGGTTIVVEEERRGTKIA
jgi:PAS domain S-box-containing protein